MGGTDRLQDFRLRKGITQEEVAEELIRLAAADGVEVKVDGSVISKWERGKKRPRRHYRRLLCRFYQAPEEDLGLRIIGRNKFCCLVRSKVEAHDRSLVDCDIFLHPKVIK
jgi:transcriptional regulator with XRE-family HTH domain